jgi:hypothetical protein
MERDESGCNLAFACPKSRAVTQAEPVVAGERVQARQGGSTNGRDQDGQGGRHPGAHPAACFIEIMGSNFLEAPSVLRESFIEAASYRHLRLGKGLNVSATQARS